jgi:hypothetical protein
MSNIRSHKSVRALLILLLGCCLAPASSISLGVLSFNVLIPSAPGSPGVDDFEIDNFTGAFALPSDFPATDSVTFTNALLLLTPQGGSPISVNLGSLGPGIFTPAPLDFSATTIFTSAQFTAALSPTNFAVSGAPPFQASSAQLLVNLIPSTGSALKPGTDFALIQASNVPEPYTPLLVFLGLSLLLISTRRSRSR